MFNKTVMITRLNFSTFPPPPTARNFSQAENKFKPQHTPQTLNKPCKKNLGLMSNLQGQTNPLFTQRA